MGVKLMNGRYLKDLLELQKEYAMYRKESTTVASRKLREICKPLVKLGFTDQVAVLLVMGSFTMKETVNHYESLRKAWERSIKFRAGLIVEDPHTDTKYIVKGKPYVNKYEVKVIPCCYEGKDIEIPVEMIGLFGYYEVHE